MKIEFVLTNPLLVEHFGPVLSALDRRGLEAAFVCVSPPRGLALALAQKRELHARCLAAVARAGLPHRTQIDPFADVALTALGSNELHLYRRHKLKFRYGVSLHRAAIHHNWAMTHGFDGLLAHGPFERDLFSRWFAPDRIKLMGVPRHDAYAHRPLTKSDARVRLGLESDETRPVLGYFPTWSGLSSLRTFLPPLLELARSHRLLVKPHALSLLDSIESGALEALRTAGARVLDDNASFAEVLAAADLALTDATSGATPEALLLAPETPLVLLTRRELNELFSEISSAGPIVTAPSALPAEVQRLLQADDYRARRTELRTRLFADYAGRAAERAVDALLELAQLPKISATPTALERLWPRVFRVARGQALALGRKWAPVPPRSLAAR